MFTFKIVCQIVCIGLCASGCLAKIQEIRDGPAGCELPESFPDGSTYPTDDSELEVTPDNRRWIMPDSALNFRCRPGYKLIGHKNVICKGLGQWESGFPKCYRKFCDPLPDPGVSGVWESRSRNFNRTGFLRCLKGYELDDPANDRVTCKRVNQTELEWTGTNGDFPRCREIPVCEDPGLPLNGQREPYELHVFYSGSKVRFECDLEHELVGSDVLLCSSNGTWDADRPRCRPNATCPDLPYEANGILTSPTMSSDYFVPGDQVELECNPGFRPEGGSNMLFCDDEETWDDDIAICRPSTCDYLNLKRNSFILEDENRTAYPYHAEIQIRCRPGFILRGINWNICTDSGWQHAMPSCNEILCRDPGIPEHGRRQGPSVQFLVGSTVSFSCHDGYALIGSVKRTCMTNGQWDGSLTICTEETGVGCLNPGVPMNGYRSGMDFQKGDVVHFGCDPGFVLQGSEDRRCGSNGQWDGDETRCRAPQDFDRPEDIKFRILTDLDSKLAVKDSQTFPTKEPFTAMAGRKLDLSVRDSGGYLIFYFIFDSSASVGKVNFQTSLQFASALVRRVGVSPTVRVGAVTYGKEAREDLFPLGTDSQDIVLKKLSEIEYMGGGTATKAAMTVVRGMISTVQRNLISNVIKSVVFLITDGVYNIGGNPETIATMIKDRGIEIYVIGLVGTQEKANARSMEIIASSSKHVFYLQGYETLEYLVDVLIHDSIDYSRCGISVRESDDNAKGRIFGGKESTIHWPWMAHISLPKRSRCGGSIIDNTWILTAAHCVDNVTAEKLNVTVGALKLVGEDDGARQYHLVAKIWIHDLYNTVPYDYDVALLKLRRPVVYGKYVRRICLTPDLHDIGNKSSLYRPGEVASVIGFGLMSYRPFMFSESLKETEVILQNRSVCLNSIRNPDAVMTERMICAGHPEGGSDSCDGDSGGPLMQQLDSGQGMEEPYWVQMGVVSWGVRGKCGLKGYYGFYTHLAQVLPWVKDVVAAKHP